MNKQWAGALYLTLAASIWGGMYVVSKYVLDYVPSFTLLWMRYLVGFLVLAILLRRSGATRIERKDWPTLLWIGFIGYFISVGAQFVGTWLSSAHMGALITSGAPAATLLFAYFILREQITWKKGVSVAVASIGVIIVIGFDSGDQNSLWGNLFLLVAAITWALYSVYVRKASQRFSALTITTYAIFFALLFTTPAMGVELYFMEAHPLANHWVWLGILYLGIVSTAGAFFLWNKGMELMEAGVGSLFFFFQPVVGALLGWLILREVLHWNFYLGGIFILGGVLLATLQEQKRNDKLLVHHHE